MMASGFRGSRFSAAAALVVVIIAARGVSAADSRETRQCLQAARSGQVLRDERKLVEARAAFVQCAQANCPAVVRKDCSQWQSDVESRTPTIVLAAKDGLGNRLTDVKVLLDGQPFATKLDGRALPVNPGNHKLRFESKFDPVEIEALILEGQRAKAIEVTLGPPPPPDSQVKKEVVEPPREPEGGGGPGVLPWVFAGVGVVGLGAGAVLNLTAGSDFHELETKCKPNCTEAQVDPIRSRLTMSYVAFGVGAAAAVTSIILFAAAPSSRSRVQVGPSVGTRFAGLEIAGKY